MRILVLSILLSVICDAAVTVDSSLVTATQGLLTYSAPSDSVCSLIVYESSSVTTTTHSVSATGSQTVTLAAIPPGVSVGSNVWIDAGSSQEEVTVTAVSLTPSQITATFRLTHSSGVTVVAPVHDVDPLLFSGSNLDSRAGNTSIGLARTFVVGLRRSQRATDGNWYSRALQANTTHVYSLTCEGSTTTGQFTTANPPLGNTYPEPTPFDASAWGHMAWPTINFTDRSVPYIDPLTGILIKRVTGPGDFSGHASGYGYTGKYANPEDGSAVGIFTYYNDLNGAWVNAANIISASQAKTASYSGSNRDPIFVSWGTDPANLANATIGMPQRFFSFGDVGNTLDNVQLALFGTGTDADAANRTVEVCLSFYDSGATCDTSYFPVELPRTAPPSSAKASVTYPAGFPDNGAWKGWGVVPQRGDVSVYHGSFSVTGSTVTNTSGNDWGKFNPLWKSGAKIYLAGSAPTCANNICTISAVTDGTHLTIAQSFASAISGNFYSLASGFIVRKATGAGTIKLSLSSAYAQSGHGVGPNGGDNPLCDNKSVTVSYDADGLKPITPVQGEFCSFPTNGGYPALWLFIPSTGETRFIDPLFLDNTATASSPMDYTKTGYADFWNIDIWDTTDANKFYVPFRYNAAVTVGNEYIHQSPNSIMTTTYKASSPSCRYQTFRHSSYPSAHYRNGQDTTNPAGGAIGGWPDSCLTYSNNNFALSTKGFLDYRIVTSSPTWKPSMQSAYGLGVAIPGIRNGKLLVASNPGGQDTGTGLWIVDAATGQIESSTSSIAGIFPTRWQVNHTTTFGSPPNTVGIGPNRPNGNGTNGFPEFSSYERGPYRFTPVTLLKDGSFTNDTSMPSPDKPGFLSACPTELSPPAGASTAAQLVEQGARGNNCISFQSKMACSAGPYWTHSATPQMAAAATATQTTLSLTSVAGISAGAYLYISTTNVKGFPTGPNDAAFSSIYPGFELVYVNSVNTASNTVTVTRSVNGVVSEIPAYTESPRPATLGGVSISQSYVYTSAGQVWVLQGSQSPEARDYPCDWGPRDIAGKPVFSEPSKIQPGDLFKNWGQNNQFGEFGTWQIVSVCQGTAACPESTTSNGLYTFVASWRPKSEANGCLLPSASTNPWPRGWSGYMIPLCGLSLYDTSNVGRGWYYHLAAGHAVFGVEAGGYPTVISSSDALDPYQIFYRMPVMSSEFVGNPKALTLPSTVPFSGYSPNYSWQSYPSQLQFSSPDPSTSRWFTDLHAINPPVGASPGHPNGGLTQNCGRGAHVAGTSNVYQWACTLPYKVIPIYAFAGKWLLQDISSPSTGDVISDSTSYSFCYAFAASECRTGSAPGNVYTSVPQQGGQLSSNLGNCITDNHDENLPCVLQVQFHAGAVIQGSLDVPNAVNNWRKITNAFTNPGSKWVYSAGTIEPTGQWAFFSCDWCSGYRTDLYAAKLPPFPAKPPLKANGFVPTNISVDSSAEFDQARVRFGYAENGDVNNFYCSQRADACVTSTSPTQASPYNFVSEAAGWATCSKGCSLTVPAIPGRVLYYVVDRKNSASGATTRSETRTAVNP